jgi:hypothetical protein
MKMTSGSAAAARVPRVVPDAAVRRSGRITGHHHLATGRGPGPVYSTMNRKFTLH